MLLAACVPCQQKNDWRAPRKATAKTSARVPRSCGAPSLTICSAAMADSTCRRVYRQGPSSTVRLVQSRHRRRAPCMRRRQARCMRRRLDPCTHRHRALCTCHRLAPCRHRPRARCTHRPRARCTHPHLARYTDLHPGRCSKGHQAPNIPCIGTERMRLQTTKQGEDTRSPLLASHPAPLP